MGLGFSIMLEPTKPFEAAKQKMVVFLTSHMASPSSENPEPGVIPAEI